MPHFVAARIAPGLNASGFSYAPWVVANVSVDRMPDQTASMSTGR